MNNKSKDIKNNEPLKVRQAFPQVCKWFEGEASNTKQAAAEVGKRFQRFEDSGTSPCDGCPLCQHH